MLSIILWELFKRLVKPQTLAKLISKHGEEGLKKLLAENENGEAGIRATAEAMEKAEDDFGNNTWFGGFDSSNINQVRYDAETSTMGVMFNSGAIYEYYDVPRSVAYEFVTWPGSKGLWSWEHIRGGSPKTSNYAYAKAGAGTPTRENRLRESGYKSTHRKARK
ncbi:MAG: KTSC domain-containing protein [Fibromonadaceae bacterium]|nr:KTSC domain-containing protein [Fibromonadaceae bacterium]